MDFKNRLKELRTDKGLTQKELADKIGFSLSIVNKWENGVYTPNTQALVALSKFFEESIEYILGKED